jgi:hypothetical protein
LEEAARQQRASWVSDEVRPPPRRKSVAEAPQKKPQVAAKLADTLVQRERVQTSHAR